MPSPLTEWLKHQAWRFSPTNLLDKLENRRFDARHGTDTFTDVRLQGLAITGPNRMRASRYHPTPPRSFRQVMARLGVDPARSTFVDFGSGKGRTLLIAAGLGFRRVVGVEFAEELHRIAQANIQACLVNGNRGAIESVHADATQYALPDGDLVLYFFKPFDAVVLRQVLLNVQQAAAKQARRVVLVFLYLEEERAGFDGLDGFVPLFSWRRFDVIEYRP